MSQQVLLLRISSRLRAARGCDVATVNSGDDSLAPKSREHREARTNFSHTHTFKMAATLPQLRDYKVSSLVAATTGIEEVGKLICHPLYPADRSA